jgi:hypothetical protein
MPSMVGSGAKAFERVERRSISDEAPQRGLL